MINSLKNFLFKFPKLSSLKIEVVGGGLEIKEVPLNIIYTFQYYLKTVTRILLRIDSFKARDLPKLYKKAKKIPWNKYFIACTPDIHIKSSESRLFDDRKISKTIISAINDYQEANACKKKLIEEYGNKGLEEERRLAYVGITRSKKLVNISFSMNRFYQGDWIDSMASRFIDELPNEHLQKNNFFAEDQNNDFEFNQDIEFESENKSPGWIRYQKRIKIK